MSNSISTKQYIYFYIGLLVLLAVTVYFIDITLFVGLSFFIAYLLNPLVNRIQQSHRLLQSRVLAILLVLSVILLVVSAAAVGVVPSIFKQLRELLIKFPEVSSFVLLKARGLFTALSDRFPQVLDLVNSEQIESKLNDAFVYVSTLAPAFLLKTAKAVQGALGFLVIPLITFYVLKDYALWRSAILESLPPRWLPRVLAIKSEVDDVLKGFLRGNFIVSSILASYYVLMFMILDLDLALILGVLAGAFNIVPYIGGGSIMVLTFIVALLHGASVTKLILLGVVFGIGGLAEGSVLTPRIVGQKVGLNPVTLVVALMVGAKLLGLVGVVTAVPLAAITNVFFAHLLRWYRQTTFYTAP